MLEQIERVLEERVRPQLALHGGDIQSLGCEDGVYRFRLLGRCASCPSAYLTTESVIGEELLQAVPGLKQVVLVQQVSDSLLDQARAILGHGHGG
ncbi:MAG: NifU family protein [Oscillospiraceae bacterium]